MQASSSFSIQSRPSWQIWKLKEFAAFCAPANQKEHNVCFFGHPIIGELYIFLFSFLFLSIYLSMQFLYIKFQN